MFSKFVFLMFLFTVRLEEGSSQIDLACSGRPHYNVTLTAYFPDFNSENESDYLDTRGKKLRSLQDYIDGRADYVTVSMDEISKLPYGSIICIPELNEHFTRIISLQVRDHGIDLKGMGYSRVDICVRSEADSYDNAVNREVTVYTQV